MIIDILTLFPESIAPYFSSSILNRARKAGIVDIRLHNIRDVSRGSYKSVDDRPFGGGTGMILRVDICDAAIELTGAEKGGKNSAILLMTPQGIPYSQAHALDLSQKKHIAVLCGHYEGFDERVRALVDREYSIGDYVLTGGELPAALIADSVVRLLPGVLEKEESLKDESFTLAQDGGKGIFLEYPQYTRPRTYKGMDVPEILLSGNHADIHAWRMREALMRTKRRRPDLLR